MRKKKYPLFLENGLVFGREIEAVGQAVGGLLWPYLGLPQNVVTLSLLNKQNGKLKKRKKRKMG